MTEITYPRNVSSALRGAELVVLLAPESALESGWHRKIVRTEWGGGLDRLIEDTKPGELGRLASTYTGEDKPRRVAIGVLPDRISRHNSPTRSEFVQECARSAGLSQPARATVLCYVDDVDQVQACACALGKALPLYSRRSKKPRKTKVAFLCVDAKGRARPASDVVKRTVESQRWAAELVDTPTAELDTATFVRRARALIRGAPRVTTKVIVGDELLKKGLGGLHGVGRAAAVAPRMLILDYKPSGRSRRTVGLVGKGIVYDTGGLNIKTGSGMSGMKGDMGGAAAVVGAFNVLARSGCRDRVVCLAPLAENAIDKDSYRPDDILELHSGKTVEINNTDAEGRLLLGDGVSYVARQHKADVVIDAATLTGAQLVATGWRFAALFTNRDGLEAAAVAAGRGTGDMTHPLPFAPEFFQAEFKSLVADMKNSVKDRMNAQSSCAAQFVYSHIQDLDVPWLHIDLAGPSKRHGRASGFGVALISTLVTNLKKTDLA